MDTSGLDQLMHEVLQHRLTRREFLRRAMALGLSLPAAAAWLAACAPAAPPGGGATPGPAAAPTVAAGPTPGGTLVLAYSSNITNMDPPRVIGQWNNIPWYAAYDGLIRFKRGSAVEVEPALAESWETSPDGLTKTFRLRRGVKFHDGAPFNAEAVVFSFMRIVDDKHPYYKADMIAGRNNFEMIQNVEAVNEFTVKMTLKWPFPYVEQMIATYDGLIVDPNTIKRYGDESSRHENGTGPFKLTEWVDGDRMVFVRHDEYWAGRPHLDRLVIRTITEPSTQLAELHAGTVHVVEGITHPRNVPAIRANPNLQIFEAPGYMTSWMGFNLTNPILKEKKVREAINYAINRESIAKNLFQGLVEPVSGWIPDISPHKDKDEKPYPYDPDRAKQLLADAGHGNGLVLNCWQGNIATPHIIIGPEIGTALQADLSKVGITLNLVQVEYGRMWGTLQEALPRRRQEMIDTWIDGIRSIVADIDNFLFNKFRPYDKGGASNYSFYEDSRTTELINQGRQTTNLQERERIYKEVQQRLREAAVGAPLFQSKVLFVGRREVQDFFVFPVVSAGRWNEVWLKT